MGKKVIGMDFDDLFEKKESLFEEKSKGKKETSKTLETKELKKKTTKKNTKVIKKEDSEQLSTFKELVKDKIYKNNKDYNLIFNKDHVYVSDKIKNIIGIMAESTSVSSKDIVDTALLEFYNKYKKLIEEQYKEFTKSQNNKLI